METAAIVQYLMEIENPSPKIVTAIESAVGWLERVKITGIRLERVDAPSLFKGYDLKIVEDDSASPLWARFYEIGTNRPIFVGREGVVRYHLSEIEQERRVGYRYYVTNPSSMETETD
jgi:PelA/Pel-15E family pectate lyase